ncbi:hypothetical protein TGDOM2_294285 [Toxoplasma gondii GAB2-2007-GAL-DOM2]|uniref:Uncharacterized protein n=2 Tax=Toxoplasma gondii TaxID=5811 RepID=A0A086KRD9_TOXGO|nr:hypothetical protein TGDOM2_294285 [Toxoplasma gondii GAB2-2007-GAL-DOM2]KFG46957.1 hypothetical protein TGFOU_294285 [Toxoplasma gondii FOU]
MRKNASRSGPEWQPPSCTLGTRKQCGGRLPRECYGRRKSAAEDLFWISQWQVSGSNDFACARSIAFRPERESAKPSPRAYTGLLAIENRGESYSDHTCVPPFQIGTAERESLDQNVPLGVPQKGEKWRFRRRKAAQEGAANAPTFPLHPYFRMSQFSFGYF